MKIRRTRDPRIKGPGSLHPERVNAARKTLTNEAEAEGMGEMFRLLGDATRLRILYALLDTTELSVGDMSKVVEAPETSVSHALRILRSSGAVKSRRDGRYIYYSLDSPNIRVLLELSSPVLKSLRRTQNSGESENRKRRLTSR